MMALVTVSTLYQTINITLLVLVSKGWRIVKPSLERDDAMNVLMIVGAVYLSYSTYYVSFGVEKMQALIGFSINVLYLLVYLIVIKNSHEILSGLRQHLLIIGP
jgi:hypothetical protein